MLFLLFIHISTIFTLIHSEYCDILVAGGTLASLGAAINSPNHLKVCLVQPTARLGGQLGDQGVWHLDLNWLYQKYYPDTTIAYNPKNLHPFLNDLMKQCNSGDCWVSRNCFMYSCVQGIIQKYLQNKTNLTIFYNTTIKSVQRSQDKIKKVQLITRLQLAQQYQSQKRQDCRNIDEIIDDWYTREPSQYYRKNVRIVDINGYVVEASQYGDLLALSNATYMQGISQENPTCGQSIVFGIHQQYPQQKPQQQIKFANIQDDQFSLNGFTVQEIWRYRRLVGKNKNIKRGQITLQNWNGPGNDYRQGYIFKNVSDSDIKFWKGGLNSTTLREAEKLSLRFHQWFKNISNLPLTLYKQQLKTCSGTSRLPYIRDGRRSVGFQNFIMQEIDVTGIYTIGNSLTATPFGDRVSIGMYNMDLHSIKGCIYPPFAQSTPLPFFIPLRAFSNKDISNLIATGRSISQKFFVSSATRTHATELAMGSASMMVAIHMMNNKIPSLWSLINCPACIRQLQAQIREIMPLQWTINDKQYPKESQNILSLSEE